MAHGQRKNKKSYYKSVGNKKSKINKIKNYEAKKQLRDY